MTRIRVVIADNYEIVRCGLRQVFASEPDIQVVGEAASGDEALAAVGAVYPDVILMDLKLPGLDGIAGIRVLRTAAVQAAILVLTASAHMSIADAVEAGATGFLAKDISGVELIRAVRLAARGLAPLHLAPPAGDLPGLLADRRQAPVPVLSERQHQVVRLVARGASNAAIGRQLCVSERTVKRELTTIFDKLGLDGRTAVVAYAYAHQLL